VSDIDTAVADSLKVLDLKRPIREDDITAYPRKFTFGELRAAGVRDVLVCCRDHKCSYHITTSVDRAAFRLAR
jgi:hypothetical protein